LPSRCTIRRYPSYFISWNPIRAGGNFGSARRQARLERYFGHAVGFKGGGRVQYIRNIRNTYEVNFDNCSVAVLSRRIRAGCSRGRQQAAGAGETEGARWLQTIGNSRGYATVGRGLCCERPATKRSASARRCASAETKRSAWARRCESASGREKVVVVEKTSNRLDITPWRSRTARRTPAGIPARPPALNTAIANERLHIINRGTWLPSAIRGRWWS
jgi:hypothetical protein